PTPVSKETSPAFAALADCAARTDHWLLALRLARQLTAADPDYAHPELVPRAEIALGLYADAQRDITALHKARPKDPEIALTSAIGACKLEKWDLCEHDAQG